MSDSPITFMIRGSKARFLAVISIILSLVLAWFGVRWQIGTMLSELTPPNDPTVKSTAKAAQGFAPRDPLSAWLVAVSTQDIFSPQGLSNSVKAFEDVVRLSPKDYRWWIELGRIDEQADRPAQAEAAFRQAAALAPSYAYPRWQLGNFLLRQGRPDEAFAELRKTTENNLTYREQVFSLAWDYFDHDPARVEALSADKPDVRVSLASFYATHSEAADALRVWNTLSDQQKADNSQTAKAIAQTLTERKFFRQGLEFSRQAGIDPDAQEDAVSNGGFEKALGSPDDNFYGWNVERSDNKLDISLDPSVRHTGNRSLRMNFRTYVKPELSNPWQFVVIRSAGLYSLHFWARTENLRSAGMPTVEVLDPTDNRLIAASSPMATGTNDWQEFSIDFKSPDKADAVVVRVSRSYCGEACPIFGLLWLDDFSLVRK
jgi:hypothetical protein